MPDRPITPPWGKPVTELRTPNQKDGFAVILINRDSAEYQAQYPIKRGTPYSSIIGADERLISEFAANPLYFLVETRPGSSSSADFGSSDLACLWIFATDELAENTYSFDRDYPGESTAVSRYVHTTHVRRIEDEATPSIAYGSTLTGLMSVNITAPGTGYTTATGTIATGATVTFVCYGGALILGIVTNQGTGVSSGGAITITGDGVGATATARIQPATAVLTHQEMKQLPDDDPRSHDYVQKLVVYEILPGPWLPFTRYDDDLGPIQGQRRAVVNTGQVATLTSTIKTTYEARDGSSYVSWEIQEIFGIGVPGFSAYPVLTGASRTVDVRGRNVDTSSTIVAHGTGPDVSSLNISSVVQDRNNQIADKKTVSIASLPPTEVVARWDWVSLPLLVFAITPNVFCNLSPFATVTLDYATDYGCSALRKHRRTVSYVTTPPDTTPNLTTSAFEVRDVRYQGKVISFALSNVLCNLLEYDADFSYSDGEEACTWTEFWNFSATIPSATEFIAGLWAVKSFIAEPFGQSMWKLTKDEYYSIPANPSI